MNKMKAFLYHIAYSTETLDAIEDGYLLLDNTENERPDWYEYWPIRKFFQQSPTLDESAYYGFFSPRFRDKTRLSYSDVVAFIESCDDWTDVFLFSPQPDIGAFFRTCSKVAIPPIRGLWRLASSFSTGLVSMSI